MNKVIKQTLILAFCAAELSCLSMAHAASFDCAKARTKVEKLICADPFISKLDGQLGKVYDKDIAKANPEQKKRLITNERYWLKDMRDLCATQTCFKHAYWQRLAELKTFYMPHSPMYAKASDKAAVVQSIITTEPLFPLGSSNRKECLDVFHALKKMQVVEFVNPLVQVMSYSNPKLLHFRQEVAKRDKKVFPQGAPLSFDYQCTPNVSPPWDIAMGSASLSECPAYYGLPPFKLFEIPRGKKYPNKVRYIFYWDSEYGPMNRWKQKRYGAGTFKYNFLYGNGGNSRLDSAPPYPGFKPSYSSVIRYNDEYYLLFVYPFTYRNYGLDVYPVTTGSICLWSPVKAESAGK